MADFNHLFGSCACERNYYEISFPSANASLASVFFDNSSSSRRATAAPVTAWLRVPLDWYQSATIAQFPDESHASIKRTFQTPTSNRLLPSTRRQFCGYCGTHLTAYNEAQQSRGNGDDTLDVTLSSLLQESLLRLEDLNILPDSDSDEGSSEGLVTGGSVDNEDHIPTSEPAEDPMVVGGSVDNEDHIATNEPAEDPLVVGGSVNNEDHIPTRERSLGGVDATGATIIPVRTSNRAAAPHRMSSRGVPYFEEMIEHSRLGRIKRQRGGHTSRDGTSSVQWEIIEIGGEEPTSNVSVTEPGGSKRQRLDV